MNWLIVWSLIEWLIRLTMVVVILRRQFMPATSLAWLTITFLLPELGLFLYLLLGDARMGRKRTRLHRLIVFASRRAGRLSRLNRHIIRPDVAPELEPVILLAENIGGMPILGGNDVELLSEAEDLIARLIADIDAAEHHVHLLYYIYACDEMGNKLSTALMRAAKRGIECRLLVDGAGSFAFWRSRICAEMETAGVKVAEALPVRLLRRSFARIDLRNHRKLAVIDGRIGYTGSHNVAEPFYGRGRKLRWIDLSARFTGPIVQQLQVVFLEDWVFDTGEAVDGQVHDEARVDPSTPAGRAEDSTAEMVTNGSVGCLALHPKDSPAADDATAWTSEAPSETGEGAAEAGAANQPSRSRLEASRYLPAVSAVGSTVAQVVPSGPSENDNAHLPNVLLTAINAARRRIVITTPYFVPDESTMMALLMAVGRGVEVDLILPHKTDHRLVAAAGRYYFEPLLEAGVKIHLFDGGLLHSKTVTVDDAFALLGSTNMDIRSFYLNFELNVLLYGKAITSELRFAQTSYLRQCQAVSLEEWRKQPRSRRMLHSLAVLLSPLL